MRLLKTVTGLRSYLEHRRHQQIGLVPTMGALHNGHFSLIKRAVAENDVAVVSIFVNPLQFAPSEDFKQYPRQLEQDCQQCEQLGVEVVFAPTDKEMGIGGTMTTVVPPPSMLSVLCGPYRPGHFQGVATIVTKLLNTVQPAIAYFGEKDAQQLAIIRRLVSDLNIPVEIRGCPIVRDASGLALSSRNQYLSASEKEQALALSRSLHKAQQAFEDGERNGEKLVNIVQQELASASGVELAGSSSRSLLRLNFEVEYVQLVHPRSLERLETIEEAGLLAIACYVGSTRLIDNVILSKRQPIIAIDGPAGAGKSTVARRVAQALALLYLDSGAMYRAVTWLVMQSGINVEDEVAVAELMSGIELKLIAADSLADPVRVQIDHKDVTDYIRTSQVTANVSAVSAQAAVRQELVRQQRRLGKHGGIVAEGRDIGTNVFPDAELKIFLTASVQERARRRFQDWQLGEETSLKQLQQDIQQRDNLDSNRSISPLRKAADAVEIDSDRLSIEDVTEQIVHLYQQKLGSG